MLEKHHIDDAFSLILILSAPVPGEFDETDRKSHSPYEIFTQEAEQYGFQIVRASADSYDPAAKVFRSARTFKDGTWQMVSNVKPDLIYDKMTSSPETLSLKRTLATTFLFLNDPPLSEITDNKWLTYQAFPHLHKPSFLVESPDDFPRALSKIKTERYFVKPLFGNSGAGVVTGKKGESVSLPDFPFLLQEFIDSSQGIPEICSGPHDLRLIFVNNTLIQSYLRIPPKESFLSNVALGGRVLMLDLERLPPLLQPLLETVREGMRAFPHAIYTVDCMLENGKDPFLVELNSKPGFSYEPGQEKDRLLLINKLLSTFSLALREKEKAL